MKENADKSLEVLKIPQLASKVQLVEGANLDGKIIYRIWRNL